MNLQADYFRQCLQDDYFDCLFTTATKRLVQRRTSASTRLPNAVMQLENDMLDNPSEPGEPASSNLLTFLYWCEGSDEEKVTKQNHDTLEQFPDNIAALTMKVRLMVNQGRFEEAKVTSESVSRLLREYPLSGLQCKAEVAYALYFLGPKFYGEAIRRYEQVFEKYDDWMREQNDATTLLSSAAVNRQLCSWHFHLARCYSKFLQINKGDATDTGLAENVYNKICSHLNFVIEKDDKMYNGKAKIELVTTKTARECVLNSNARGTAAVREIREVMNVAPTDQYVLERCARQLINPPHIEELLREALHILAPFERSGYAWQCKARAHVFLYKLKIKESNPSFSSSLTDERQPTVNFYLHEAKRCYNESIRLADDVFFNRVDLARTCMGLDELDEADTYFTEAERLMKRYPGDVYETNISYLYCHWAFLRSKQATKLPRDEKLFQDFRIKCRKSFTVFNADTHREKNLLGMLRDDLRILSLTSCNKAIKLEKDILEQALQQDKFSKRPLVTAAEHWDHIGQKMRQLVKTLSMNNNNSACLLTSLEDALTRFLYLSSLWKAEKLDLRFRSDVQLVLDTIEWLLYVDERLPHQHSLDTGEHHGDELTFTFNFPVRDAFRWIIGNETLSARGFRAENNASPKDREAFIGEEEVIDVCLLVLTTFQSENSGYTSIPVYRMLLATLRNYLGLNVASFGLADFTCQTEFDDKLDNESNWVEFDRELDDAISHSRIVLLMILNEDSGLSQTSHALVDRRESCQRNWPDRLNGILRDLPNVKKAKDVCLVLSNTSDSECFGAIEDDYLKRWPPLKLPEYTELTHQGLVRLLVTNLTLFH